MMSLTYPTGEEIKKGDLVQYWGGAAQIELVAADPDDPETDWYLREIGEGVMVVGGTAGRLYIPARYLREEELEFVSRRQ